uniref:Uncharacterized protein n=1 Tax=Anguilla anguilla TaxID=7936 RepID=A0A0E9VNG8_ANGAN
MRTSFHHWGQYRQALRFERSDCGGGHSQSP